MKPKLGDFGASLIRFSYAIPFAWAWIYLYGDMAGQTIPVWNQPFLFWVTIAAVMQIIFTVTLVMLFSHRSFAAGTAFSKTEVIQAAKERCENSVTSNTVKMICVTPATVVHRRNERFRPGSATPLQPA